MVQHYVPPQSLIDSLKIKNHDEFLSNHVLKPETNEIQVKTSSLLISTKTTDSVNRNSSEFQQVVQTFKETAQLKHKLKQFGIKFDPKQNRLISPVEGFRPDRNPQPRHRRRNLPGNSPQVPPKFAPRILSLGLGYGRIKPSIGTTQGTPLNKIERTQIVRQSNRASPNIKSLEFRNPSINDNIMFVKADASNAKPATPIGKLGLGKRPGGSISMPRLNRGKPKVNSKPLGLQGASAYGYSHTGRAATNLGVTPVQGAGQFPDPPGKPDGNPGGSGNNGADFDTDFDSKNKVEKPQCERDMLAENHFADRYMSSKPKQRIEQSKIEEVANENKNEITNLHKEQIINRREEGIYDATIDDTRELEAELRVGMKSYQKHYQRHALDIDPTIPHEMEAGAEKINLQQLKRQDLVLPMAHPANEYKLRGLNKLVEFMKDPNHIVQIGYFRGHNNPALFIFNPETLQFAVFIPNNDMKNVFDFSTFFKVTREQFNRFMDEHLLR